MITTRIETLVIARVFGVSRPQREADLIAALVRYNPSTMIESAWRDAIERAIAELRAGVLDDRLQLADRGELANRIGKHTAKTWLQLANKVLPALALGVAPSDTKILAKLGDATHPWAAAITARSLGVWTTGAPLTLGATCDAFAWAKLGLAGKPKRCPPEIRAVFLQRELGTDPSPPERQVRLYAANAVGSPRGESGQLRDALVRLWCAGKVLGARPFAAEVRDVATAARDGVFGDRRVFIASVWNELRRHPTWSALTLDEFKARLVAAHRAGDLELVRADYVTAMDPDLVAASETTTDGASYHFILREAA